MIREAFQPQPQPVKLLSPFFLNTKSQLRYIIVDGECKPPPRKKSSWEREGKKKTTKK